MRAPRPPTLLLLTLAAVGVGACTQLFGLEPGREPPKAPAPVEASVEPSAKEASTCEANLRVDPHHCGRCDRDCLGADCLEGHCLPVRVAELGLDGPAKLTPAAGGFVAVYPTPGGFANRVLRITSDGTVTTIAEDVGEVAVGGTDLYSWSCAFTGVSAGPNTNAQRACTLTRRSLLAAAPSEEVLPVRMLVTPASLIGNVVLPYPVNSVTPRLAYDQARGRVLAFGTPPPTYAGDTPRGIYAIAGDGARLLSSVPLDFVVPLADGWLGLLETPMDYQLARVRDAPCDAGPCVERLLGIGYEGEWLVLEDRALFWDVNRQGGVRFGSVRLEGGGYESLGEVAPVGVVPVGPRALSPRGTYFATRSQVFVIERGAEPELLVDGEGEVRAIAEVGGRLYWLADAALWELAL